MYTLKECSIVRQLRRINPEKSEKDLLPTQHTCPPIPKPILSSPSTFTTIILGAGKQRKAQTKKTPNKEENDARRRI